MKKAPTPPASSTRRECCIYVRVSRPEQEAGYSPAAQLELLEGYATRNNFHIAKRFIIAESAKEPGRKTFQKILDYLQEPNAAKVLLVEKTDRLLRNLKDLILLDDLKPEIHLVKEGTIISPDSPSHERLFFELRVVMAKHYIANLAEEAKKGMKRKAQEGMWPSYAPLGYLNTRLANHRSIIVPDLERAPIIRKVLERYDTGKFAVDELWRLAVSEGLAFRSGKPISKSEIHRILRRKTYTGRFDWNGVEYEGTYEPLVSYQLWQRIQLRMDEKPGLHRGKAPRSFTFTGILRCGHCGCAITAEEKTKTKKNKEKVTYLYYHCTGYKGKCGDPYLTETEVTRLIAAKLKELEIDTETAGAIVDTLKESRVQQREYHEQAVAKLQQRVSKLQGRLDQLYIDKLDGVVDEEKYAMLCQEWRGEQDKHRRSIHSYESADRSFVDEGVRIIELVKGMSSKFLRQSPERRRRLANLVLSNSILTAGRLTSEFRQPFAIIADMKILRDEGSSSKKGAPHPE